jgi:hypothetical protein
VKEILEIEKRQHAEAEAAVVLKRSGHDATVLALVARARVDQRNAQNQRAQSLLQGPQSQALRAWPPDYDDSQDPARGETARPS